MIGGVREIMPRGRGFPSGSTKHTVSSFWVGLTGCPLPDVAGQVTKSQRVGFETPHGRGSLDPVHAYLFAILASVCEEREITIVPLGG